MHDHMNEWIQTIIISIQLKYHNLTLGKFQWSLLRLCKMKRREEKRAYNREKEKGRKEKSAKRCRNWRKRDAIPTPKNKKLQSLLELEDDLQSSTRGGDSFPCSILSNCIKWEPCDQIRSTWFIKLEGINIFVCLERITVTA